MPFIQLRLHHKTFEIYLLCVFSTKIKQKVKGSFTHKYKCKKEKQTSFCSCVLIKSSQKEGRGKLNLINESGPFSLVKSFLGNFFSSRRDSSDLIKKKLTLYPRHFRCHRIYSSHAIYYFLFLFFQQFIIIIIIICTAM